MNRREVYYPGQYGYNATKSTNVFLRMRLNNGILPMGAICGGACGTRADGLCKLSDFLASQQNADKLASYQFACFGKYNVTGVTSGKDYDGTISQ